MELSIWYSHNHKCFKTKIGYVPWNADIGYVNGYDEELIAFTSLLVPKRTFKDKTIKVLKNVIKKLEK